MGRSTGATVLERVKVVQELLLKGETRSEIIHFASNQWSVTERTACNYLSQATAIIKEAVSASAQDILGAVLRNHWRLYNKTLQAGNDSEARANLQAIAKLRGLEEFTLVIDDKRELAQIADEDIDDESLTEELHS